MNIVFVSCVKNGKLYRNDPSYVYRCDNLAHQLSQIGHRCSTVHLSKFKPSLKNDVVVFHRPLYSYKLSILVTMLKAMGVVCVLDVDDLVFDPEYAAYSPAVVNDVVSYKKIKKKFNQGLKALKLFKIFTVSTAPLLKHIEGLVPQSHVFVIPNAVHFSWWDKVSKPRTITAKNICYLSGTNSHNQDFKVVNTAIERFLNLRQDVKLVLTGPLKVDLNVRKEQLVFKDKVPFELHYKNYEDAWICIAPLDNSPFNECKSALKVIEAGHFGIPTICSSNPDNSRFRDSGVMEVLNTEEAWFDAFESAYDDDKYRVLVERINTSFEELSSNESQVASYINFLNKACISHVGKWYWLDFYKALGRKDRGEHNLHTLRRFNKLNNLNSYPIVFLLYLLSRRDLGYGLTESKALKLEDLASRLTKKYKVKANLLLDEYKSQSACLWSIDFENYLKKNLEGGIIVVGNAPIHDELMGSQIDKHAVVIRFNYCCLGANNRLKPGDKTDVWVKAPDVKQNIHTDIDWLVLSGPQKLWKMPQNLESAKFEHADSVTDFPLSVWRDLVKILKSPPSSGIAMLYWIKNVLGSFEGVSAVGFDSNQSNDYQNKAEPHKPSSRHNWVAEKALFERFKDQGLNVYD